MLAKASLDQVRHTQDTFPISWATESWNGRTHSAHTWSTNQDPQNRSNEELRNLVPLPREGKDVTDSKVVRNCMVLRERNLQPSLLMF